MLVFHGQVQCSSESIPKRFNITTVYNYNNGNQFIEHISDEKIFLSDDNLRDASTISDTDITIFFSNDQLFSKVNLNSTNYLLLLKYYLYL